MRDLILLSEVAGAAAENDGGFDINGPLIVAENLFEIFGISFSITESVTVQWVVMLFLATLFFVLGRNLKIKPEGKRQAIAEMLVGTFSNMVKENMGVTYSKYTPYIGCLFMFSLCLSLSCLFGFRPPTSDVSVIAAWGVVTFVLITRNRFKTMFKSGNYFAVVKHYINPLNLVSEISNPMSQSLRHFGNILAGLVIGGIIYWALGSFAVIIPAAVSLYFDIFSGVLQAFIFVTLTMVWVAMAEIEPKPDKN
jgi:F-type H+-transporting ATPase subunit a